MAAERLFEKIRPQKISDTVVAVLRKAILDGVLRPGEQLNETKIARDMGISRGPVREAILELQMEGLVQTKAHQGASVVNLDPESYAELLDVRRVLETYAIQLIAARWHPDYGAELERIIDAMRDASEQGDLEGVAASDVAFHRAICRLSGNRVLLQLWEQLMGRLRLAFVIWLQTSPHHSGKHVEDHVPILDALKQGDAELASRLNAVGSRDAIITALSTRAATGDAQ